MPKFRKKPVEIEARQWDGTEAGALPILTWITKARNDAEAAFYCEGPNDIKEIEIRTLEGDMCASPGDWIICGVKGEFYPIKDDIFRATYEAVDAT